MNMPMFVNEVNLIPKYGANNLLLTILPFFFIVTATNLAIPKNKPTQNRCHKLAVFFKPLQILSFA
jgi:hypothetical protein